MQNHQPDPELLALIDRYLDMLAIVRAESRMAELFDGGDCQQRPTVSQPPPARKPGRPRLSAGVPPHRALESRQQDNGGEQ